MQPVYLIAVADQDDIDVFHSSVDLSSLDSEEVSELIALCVDKDVTEFSEYSDSLAISESEYPVDPVYLSIRKKLGKSTITKYNYESFRLLTEPVYILNP